jgi:hypothetical protein
MDIGKEILKQRAEKFCWMRSSLLPSLEIIEFQTTKEYSGLDLTRDFIVSSGRMVNNR